MEESCFAMHGGISVAIALSGLFGETALPVPGTFS